MTADVERADWLAWRREGIGASDIAGIVGVSNWSSPWSVWADKMGLVPDEQSQRLRIGQVLETALAQLFHEETGLHVIGAQTRAVHRRHRWARATLDGLVAEHGGARGHAAPVAGWEAKTDGGSPWTQVPAVYQAQAQWGMLVTGLRRWHFAVLFGRFQFKVYELAYNPDDARFIAWAAARFWHRHIATKTPPPVDGSDATTRAITLAHQPALDGEQVEIPLGLALQWRLADREAKAAAARLAEAANEVRAAIGNATIATVDGDKVATWREQTARRVDLDALRAAHPSLVEQFTTTTTSRVLRYAGKKEIPAA